MCGSGPSPAAPSGAALGVLHLAGRLTAPLAPMAKHELDAALVQAGKAGAEQLLALVTGARGRSGRGAQRAGLADEGGPSRPWRAADRAFDEAIGKIEAPEGA